MKYQTVLLKCTRCEYERHESIPKYIALDTKYVCCACHHKSAFVAKIIKEDIDFTVLLAKLRKI